MKVLKKILKIFGIVAFGAIVLLYFYLPSLASTGKLLGNQSVHVLCLFFSDRARHLDTNNSSFDFSALSDDAKRGTMGYLWNRNMNFWVKTNFVWTNAANREVVVVCDKEFDNWPKPALWNFYQRHPGHIVVYSDGKVGLINPDVYSNLNFARFATLSQLLPTNFFEPSSK